MRLARILSFIFHPVFMPMAGIFILLTFGGWMSMMPAVAKTYIYFVTVITSSFTSDDHAATEIRKGHFQFLP
jgi:hypothetical protein